MTNHPRRNKLAEYGGRIIETDGHKTVELRDPNDNAERRFQYRRRPEDGVQRRVLRADGKPFTDTGSPWEQLTDDEIASMRAIRDEYHPILDPLGL